MKRVPLYSRANAATGLVRPEDPPSAGSPPPPQAEVGEARVRRPGVLRRFASRHDRPLLVATGAAMAAIAIFALQRGGPAPKALTQADIDKAVLHTLSTKQLPSPAAKAAEIIGPAVVRVRGISPGERGDPDLEEGVGTGVVIVDTGVILTNLHVVTGSEKVRIEFADGHEADAAVISTKAEHDLAVLQAKSLPKDGVTAATLRSTAELKPGDQVVAVGFPFGIGPSVSSGVISGLQREFRSPQGKRVLTNLIQFDAAANPGNSGGPLVTMDGEVVGIVTAILNPSRERTFIGIGFAVPIENAASGIGMHPF
jgi:S1-C subfamily serine protease